MKFLNSVKFLAPAAMLLVAAVPASAGAINGDFSINWLGSVSYTPGGDLKDAATIQLPVAMGVNGLLDNYLTDPNDFCTTGADLCLHTGPAPLTLATSVSFNSNWDALHLRTLDLSGAHLPQLSFTDTNADNYTFDATSMTVTRGTTGGSTGVSVYYAGLLNDSNSSFDANMAASLSFTFTQTGGPTGSVSGGGTFATPPEAPPNTTPEPATMALLGSALVGVGLFGRKRFAR